MLCRSDPPLGGCHIHLHPSQPTSRRFNPPLGGYPFHQEAASPVHMQIHIQVTLVMIITDTVQRTSPYLLGCNFLDRIVFGATVIRCDETPMYTAASAKGRTPLHVALCVNSGNSCSATRKEEGHRRRAEPFRGAAVWPRPATVTLARLCGAAGAPVATECRAPEHDSGYQGAAQVGCQRGGLARNCTQTTHRPTSGRTDTGPAVW